MTYDLPQELTVEEDGPIRIVTLNRPEKLNAISAELQEQLTDTFARADAAGFRTALYAGLDVVGPLYATQTEFGQKFRDIVAAKGVPAAVRWRSAQFRE